ncbi:unnamed protein product [Heterosigma akashiwo]
MPQSSSGARSCRRRFSCCLSEITQENFLPDDVSPSMKTTKRDPECCSARFSTQSSYWPFAQLMDFRSLVFLRTCSCGRRSKGGSPPISDFNSSASSTSPVAPSSLVRGTVGPLFPSSSNTRTAVAVGKDCEAINRDTV